MSKIVFPRAFAFAVDDLGWNEGGDLSRQEERGPHRGGVRRNFGMRDYQYMVDVGKAVGARIQCLFILSEMDRENILSRFPTTTYLRDKWNNDFRVNGDQKRIMHFVRDESAFMEFGLHGTGHEYWEPGQPQKRAEWYNLVDRKPWPEESLREHIQCFRDIMAQYGFDKANGHSFPESFVPCAYSYYWNPNGDYSLGKLLSEVGVKYANTDFSQIPELNPPPEPNGGDFDFGTHVINRINYGNVWYELNSLPKTPVAEQLTDVIESHWPNWLAQDDFLQPEVTRAWIDYYRSVQRMSDRYIAKNTEQLHSQWLYNKFTKIVVSDGVVLIDNTNMPEEVYRHKLLGNLVLKIKLNDGEHITSASLGSENICCYFEDEGYAFLYLPMLNPCKYELTYKIGNSLLPVHVFNDGTYNVYQLNYDERFLKCSLKIYGSQIVRIRCKAPATVASDSRALIIDDHRYSNGEIEIAVRARDMQGSTGDILIQFK